MGTHTLGIMKTDNNAITISGRKVPSKSELLLVPVLMLLLMMLVSVLLLSRELHITLQNIGALG